MSDQPVLAPPGAAPDSTPALVPLDDILQLLDDTGLTFTLHTHHPGTHLEYGQRVPADPWANVRNACPGGPAGLPTGWEVRG